MAACPEACCGILPGEAVMIEARIKSGLSLRAIVCAAGFPTVTVRRKATQSLINLILFKVVSACYVLASVLNVDLTRCRIVNPLTHKVVHRSVGVIFEIVVYDNILHAALIAC